VKALCFLFLTIKYKIVGYASFALMPSISYSCSLKYQMCHGFVQLSTHYTYCIILMYSVVADSNKGCDDNYPRNFIEVGVDCLLESQ
jgi:hypothetical protein